MSLDYSLDFFEIKYFFHAKYLDVKSLQCSYQKLIVLNKKSLETKETI